MKKIVLTALIIGLMLTMSCQSNPKDMDEQYKNLYDANTGLDLTGSGTYTVKKGDTLSDISKRAYNDGFYYPIIMLASQGVVINPDKIKPGMALTIPDLEKNKANANSRKSMKNCLNGFASIEKSKSKPNQRLIEGFRKRAEEL
ncbi:LysM peptidoglycan-binding domain-containing protein [Treponema sp. R6D11]